MVLNNVVKSCAAASIVLGSLFLGAPANAVATPAPLGTAEAFAVLGGQSVSNTGPTVVTGDVGVSPGTSVTGFPPGIVIGTFHAADAVALQAQNDLTTAYNNAAGQAPDAAIAGDLGGQTLVAGVYNATSSLGLTGTVTLDAQGDTNAVWVFQAGSTLTTASASKVNLINGASPCNVFWQVGSSATLGSGSTMVGTVMALTSISATTGTTVQGRLLARHGSLTLDSNIVTAPNCATPPANHAPVATDDSVSTDFETPVDFTADAVDADDDGLTYAFGPVDGIGGVVTCDAVGSPECTYTPPDDQSGTATVTFTASDGSLTDSATVTFIVDEEGAGPPPTPPSNQTESSGVPSGDDTSDVADSSDEDLPDTGGVPAKIGWLGAGLVVAGVVTVVGTRRRRGIHRA